MPRTIRASEIASYMFCQRAWWYLKSGMPSENTGELVMGSDLHARHGRVMLGIGCLRVLGTILILSALILLAVYSIQRII